MAVAGEIRQSHGSLAEAAVEMIQDGMVVGLGSGHTVAAVVKLLGRRVQDGLHIRGVPTSGETAQLATRLGMDFRKIPGVVGTGLFLEMADIVLVEEQNDVRVIEKLRRGGK
jgi:ribose 5-phosphate isomerase A